jgi:hypothetical protein
MAAGIQQDKALDQLDSADVTVPARLTADSTPLGTRRNAGTASSQMWLVGVTHVKPLNASAPPAVGVPQGEVSGGCSVQILSKFLMSRLQGQGMVIQPASQACLKHSQLPAPPAVCHEAPQFLPVKLVV